MLPFKKMLKTLVMSSVDVLTPICKVHHTKVCGTEMARGGNQA